MAHIDGWIWLIGIGLFFFGVAAGFTLSRYNDTRWKRSQELQKELDQLDKEFQTYRSDVAQHFVTSAHLVNNLSQTYRHVIEHMALDSQRLCGDGMDKSLDFDKQKALLENTHGHEPAWPLQKDDVQVAKNEIPDRHKHDAAAGKTSSMTNIHSNAVSAKLENDSESTEMAENSAANDDKPDTPSVEPASSKQATIKNDKEKVKPEPKENANKEKNKVTVLDSRKKPDKKAQGAQRRITKLKSPATTSATKRGRRKTPDKATPAKTAAKENTLGKTKPREEVLSQKKQAQEKTDQDWFPENSDHVMV